MNSLIKEGEDQALVDGWLRALGARAGLPLQLDAEGVCAIGHSSGLDCAIEVPEGAGTAYLRAPLLPWPPESAAGALGEYCLSAHFLGLGTAGACFAINPRSRELVIWKALGLSLFDATSFADALLQFLDLAAQWRDELQAFDRRELPPPDGGAQAESPLLAARA